MIAASRYAAWLGLALMPVVLAPQGSPQPPTRLAVRFHHVHYAVEDPGAALAPAAEQLGGTRALLPGIGVGIRVGREYVLFDRLPPAISLPSDMRPLGISQPHEAIAWLEAQGLAVESPVINIPASSALPADAVLDHLAFAASDLRAVLARIKGTPTSVTDTAARFRLASGSIIEIVRDTVGADTHWCPMHPDVRRPGVEKCPRCGMALVPIPPPRLGEYRMDVTLTPRRGGGASGMRLLIRDPDGARGPGSQGAVVSEFIAVHERPLHLFIVSRDLETFAHVHPERRANGTFALNHDLPPGAYGVMADFLPASGTAQLLQRVVVTPGYKGSLFTVPTLTPSPLAQSTGGLRITLEQPDLRARRPSVLRFQISDEATKEPFRDLEPYLGAAGHLIVVSPDLTTAFHGHPEGAASTGPEVIFDPTFPASGLYKMWVQFQRKGQVVTASFVVSVP